MNVVRFCGGRKLACHFVRVRGVRHDTLEQAAEAELKDVRPDAKHASCRGRDLGAGALRS